MLGSESPRRDFLVSIRPSYVEKIIDGSKTVELRRRFPSAAAGSIALIYSSSPVQAIVGYAVIREVQRRPLRDIWSRYGQAACITRDAFHEYFDGLEEGYAIIIDRAKRFSREVTAADLRERFGFVPPQSFRYLGEEYYSLIENEHDQAPHRHKRRHRARRR